MCYQTLVRSSRKMAVDKRFSSTGSSLSEVDHYSKTEKKMYTTWPEMLKHWPKTTLCIVSNEFCERFSYYGMRTVLILYLLNVLKFTDNQSTIFFNSFTVLCYLTPLLGSIIADGYIGKFWTIFSVSILYAIGQVILAVASVKNYESSVHPWMDFAGLIIIGFGTGGIKPCVSAFGGDQFDAGQERMLSLFFSMFYFSINAGSMISTFISPIFRSQPCLGQDSCYPLAFGIPAILMIIATCLFMAGSFWYKKPPPKENVFGEVTRLMGKAVSNKFTSNSSSRAHWLDHYLDTHVCESDPKCISLRIEKKSGTACQKDSFINDVKSLLRVLVMFLPVPMFWALYDQQGSVWLIQGIQMDCRLWGNVLFLPDQVQTLNAVLILVFIPIFQVIIYPIASKCVTITPLRKMVVGGFLASLSFLITGFVQLSVNQTLPLLPEPGEAFVSVWNQLDGCSVTVQTDDMKFTVAANSSLFDSKKTGHSTFHIKGKNDKWIQTFQISYACSRNDIKDLPTLFTTELKSKTIYYIAINKHGIYKSIAKATKPTQGTGEFSLGITMATDNGYYGNLAMCRLDANNFDAKHPCDPRRPSDFYFWETNYNDGKNDNTANVSYTEKNSAKSSTPMVSVYKFKPVKPGRWGLFYLYGTPKNVNHPTPKKQDVNVSATNIEVEIHEQGGVYVLGLTGNNNQPIKHVYQVVQSNSVSILWQIPQIVVITAAEILFSITGYEFAYSQSAPSMKALVQALWLFTTAIGDSIIVLITALDLFSNMATEFFAYAGAMAAVIIIFALMSIFYYEYRYYTQDEEDCCENEDKSSLAVDNKAFPHDLQDENITYLTNTWTDEDLSDERF